MEIGRYRIFDEIAAGGMASVHLARLVGPGAFSRVVAIKRLHRHLAGDADFRAMLLDEARLSARVEHANVVRTLDVVDEGGEVFIVMEHVVGVSLARVLREAQGNPMPLDVAVGIVVQMLHGLHAAHEARGTDGMPLGIVHRDVSPQNVLVAADGTARLIDFGIAKARTRLTSTEEGVIKGKLGYMAAEQLTGAPARRETDVFGAAVVLWELVTGERLFPADEGIGAVASRVADDVSEPPSARRAAADVPPALDAAVLRGLALRPAARFSTALAMVDALAAIVAPAPPSRIATWLDDLAGGELELQRDRVAAVERRDLALAEPAPSLSPSVLDVPVLGATVQDPVKHDVSSQFHDSVRGGAKVRIGVLAAVSVMALAAALLRRAPVAAPVVAVAPPVAVESAFEMAAVPAPPATGVAVSAATARPATRAPIKRTQVRSSKAAGRCAPPFTFDDAGRKIYKPDCF